MSDSIAPHPVEVVGYPSASPSLDDEIAAVVSENNSVGTEELMSDANAEECATQIVSDAQPSSASPTKKRMHKFSLGTRIRKKFGTEWYEGAIHECWGDNNYHVYYDDSDEEDLSEDELEQCIDNYRKKEQRMSNKNKRHKKSSTTANKQNGIVDLTLEREDGSSSLWEVLPSDHSLREDPVKFILEKVKSDPPKVMSIPFGENKIALRHAMLEIAKFFLFIIERQLIWQRRNNQESPCTQNVIFRESHFCNNYRELDRGTAYLRSQELKLLDEKYGGKLPGRLQWITEVLWMSYIYRLSNKVESFDDKSNPAKGIPRFGAFDDEFVSYVMNRKEDGLRFFTAAHQTTNYVSYCDWCKQTHDRDVSPVAMEIYNAGADLKKVCNIIKQGGRMMGCGSFLSWQIACDLKEAKCLGGNVNENDFCELGPGAKNGLALIFGGGGKDNDHLQQAKILLELQPYVEDMLQITFPRWNDRPLTLTLIEHALCEYSKYEKLAKALNGGKQTINRRWRSRGQMDAKKPCFSCKKDPKDCNSAGVRCETCFSMYCNDCDPKACADKLIANGVGWICGRCKDFERLSFPDESQEK